MCSFTTKNIICTFVLLMKPGKNNFPFPQISWTVLYQCTKQQKCRTINGIREKKTVTDTYPMLYRFCSMGSFLFCIIMSKNVNNGHKVYFLPRCICKGQVHDSKNDFWDILVMSPPSNKGDLKISQQLRQVNVSQNHSSIMTTGSKCS